MTETNEAPTNPNVGFDEYKGNKLIVLDVHGQYPFKFGKGKAKMIVEHYEAIKKFAEGL